LSFILLPYSIFPMIPFPKNAVILAPMVGITNRAFRTLLDETGGPDYAFTEMASAEAFTSHAQYEAFYTDARPSPKATSVQFYARSAENLAAACREVLKRDGATAPAGIDINFGCSAPHIRKSGGGSAWSSDPAGATALVAAARAAWPGTLSAKVRMGLDDNYDRLLSFCSSIAGAGLDFLTVHPRTDGQKFRRSPRHDYTAWLSRDLSIPIIANGDITSIVQARSLLDKGAAYAVMVGREAVRRPWIFRILRAGISSGDPCVAIDRLNMGLRFLDLVETLLPEAWRLETSRRFFSYYCEQMSFAHHIKYRMMNSPTIGQMSATLTEYFDQVPDDRMVNPENLKI
jgi:tRNA-dihydrouridine synthase B